MQVRKADLSRMGLGAANTGRHETEAGKTHKEGRLEKGQTQTILKKGDPSVTMQELLFKAEDPINPKRAAGGSVGGSCLKNTNILVSYRYIALVSQHQLFGNF